MQEYACVFSTDIEEGRLAELLLRERYAHTELLTEYDDAVARNASLLVFDTDTVTPPYDLAVRVITFGRTRGEHPPYPFLSRPYSVAAMRALIGVGGTAKADTVGFYLSQKERVAEVDGERIPLTKQEYALLLRLYEATGDTVSRDILLESLFSERTEENLNVYIHYLRKKLEKSGKRLIFSSRGKGYALIL